LARAHLALVQRGEGAASHLSIPRKKEKREREN
jgi:hypothetical protein